MKQYYIYIMANESNRVLYVGITSNLPRRVYEHKDKLVAGFTSKYELHKLVYFEETSDVSVALDREKKLKKWPREYKNKLINKFNPKWDDFYQHIL